MTHDARCLCGYAAASTEGLGDHLAEVFTPDDDLGPDGVAHAEAVSTPMTGPVRADGHSPALACLCGYPAEGITGMDAHLASVFTPADQIGRDGIRHAPAHAAGGPA